MLLDGANGVANDPREHFPQGSVSGVLAAVALVATLVLLRQRVRRVWLALVLLAAAAPGLAVVLSLRADAPVNRPRLAEVIDGDLRHIQAVAPWPTPPVNVTHEEDDVLFPLGRYALPTRPPTPPGARELELGGSRLGAVCFTKGHDAACAGAK